jgi:uncharacterized coiled-coil protein SlyX
VRFLRSWLRLDVEMDRIDQLEKRLAESEKKIEKLAGMLNILATFGEEMAKDTLTIASHVALLELSMVERRKTNIVQKTKSDDDDIIN